MSAIHKQNNSSATAAPELNAIQTQQQTASHQKATSVLPLAITHFNEMPDSGYVRAPVVLALFGISRATLYRWARSARIPAPKTMGRTSLYQVGELRTCFNRLQSGQANEK